MDGGMDGRLDHRYSYPANYSLSCFLPGYSTLSSILCLDANTLSKLVLSVVS